MYQIRYYDDVDENVLEDIKEQEEDILKLCETNRRHIQNIQNQFRLMEESTSIQNQIKQIKNEEESPTITCKHTMTLIAEIIIDTTNYRNENEELILKINKTGMFIEQRISITGEDGESITTIAEIKDEVDKHD